jgi:hypothetical protein
VVEVVVEDFTEVLTVLVEAVTEVVGLVVEQKIIVGSGGGVGSYRSVRGGG